MFEPTSRYASIEDAMLTSADSTTVVYKKRRFLPQPAKMAKLLAVLVRAGDRLDTITAKTIGDPEQFWRICDANEAMYPPDLLSEPGRTLIIPVPGR